MQYDLPVNVVLFDGSPPGTAGPEVPVSGLPPYAATHRDPDADVVTDPAPGPLR
ncbi:hypothetical protein [Streptomyces sp. NPDC090022]|uniref:hypothetical protein n=1 Tax=Streptomyces sp. NPDC090022 TaxID=3365920 RepID=UPI003827D2DC